MSVDEKNLQVIDVEVIVEKLSNSITLRHMLTSSAMMMFVIHTIPNICDNMGKIQ